MNTCHCDGTPHLFDRSWCRPLGRWPLEEGEEIVDLGGTDLERSA